MQHLFVLRGHCTAQKGKLFSDFRVLCCICAGKPVRTETSYLLCSYCKRPVAVSFCFLLRFGCTIFGFTCSPLVPHYLFSSLSSYTLCSLLCRCVRYISDVNFAANSCPAMSHTTLLISSRAPVLTVHVLHSLLHFCRRH